MGPESGCHLSAQLGTAAAGFGTPLTMLMLELAADIRALLANLCTDTTDFRMNLRPAQHQRSAELAQIRTVSAGLDAGFMPRHADTGFHAAFACFQAGQTGLDTSVHFLFRHRVSHRIPLK